MNSKILKATVKSGTIVPQKGSSFGQYKNMTHVKILLLTPQGGTKKRATYNGALKKGWGDPVCYQRKIRKELGN